MATKLFGRDLKEYEDMNVEEILDKLSPEELEELNNYVDPDVRITLLIIISIMRPYIATLIRYNHKYYVAVLQNSYLPANERCRDQTTKAPTGPLNREKLMKFIEKKAREEKDWDEAVPFEPGVVRG